MFGYADEGGVYVPGITQTLHDMRETQKKVAKSAMWLGRSILIVLLANSERVWGWAPWISEIVRKAVLQ